MDASDHPATNAVGEVRAGPVVQAASVTGGVHIHSARPDQPVPRQLLAAPPHFVGRDDELARLDAAGTVLISALAGAGGIGKTALALHWAHRNLDRFPDGQLFVDLQGFTPAGRPMDPATALRGFLDAFGVAPDRIPADLSAQAALYRSLVAGKRMLIVLDNAADSAQVVPLLPGSPSCTVLVTSRRHLTTLVTRHGAHHLPLDVLAEADARQLLLTRLGRRAEAEPAALDRVLACCGGFALALDIVAARTAMHPAVLLDAVAEEVREATLDALEDADPAASLPDVLSWSVQALTGEQTRAFALLGTTPGPDIGLYAAASLVGLPLARTRQVLRALVEASLLTVDARGRYSMHDLVRGYATNFPEPDREAASRRVGDFYLHTAFLAGQLHYPFRAAIQLGPPAPGTGPQPLKDAGEALTWFDTEHANLLAAQRAASTQRRYDVVWQLAWAMTFFHNYRGHRGERLAAWQVALGHIGELSDPATRILVHRQVGRAHAKVRQYEEAIEHLHRALALAERHDDLDEQAAVHGNLAWVWENRGDLRRAIEHAARDLAISGRLGHPVQQADALNTMGRCAAQLGEYDVAREYSQQALSLHREHDHRHGEAFALATLGYADHHTGLRAQAIPHYEQAIAIFRDIGFIAAAADALDGLGHVLVACGDQDRARTVWQEALALYQQEGSDWATVVQRQLDGLDQQ